jgi:polyisoprenoid-binding protein YceI
MVTTVRGQFKEFTGEAVVVTADPAASKVEVKIQAASIDTGVADRDAHLRSADFFDVDGGGSPTMTFTSSGIKDDDGELVLFGDLTINGVTRQVEFSLEFDGVNTDPWSNTKAAFSASTEINRKDFGLEWNVALETGGVLVGEKVKVQLDIQAVKA